MDRALLAAAITTVLVLTAGCRMCAHPYDYCGPTFTGRGGEPCAANARQGSILSPAGEPGVGYEVPPGRLMPMAGEMAGPAPGVEEAVKTAVPRRQPRRAVRPAQYVPRR